VQFLLIGAVLFLGYQALHPGPEATASSTRIELTEDDLRQMSIGWLAQGRPAPTPEQMRGLVEMRIREEILFREELALGLDKGDAIVKRRLAQKMEFLRGRRRFASRRGGKAWFEEPGRFAPPPPSFRHPTSLDRRGAWARGPQALDRSAASPQARRSGGACRPFMFQDYYGDRSFEEMAKLFGPRSPGLSSNSPRGRGRSSRLRLASGLWTAHPQPRACLRGGRTRQTEWIADQRAETRRRAEAMRARFGIVLPAPPRASPRRAVARKVP
jgi:hypothetical protein